MENKSLRSYSLDEVKDQLIGKKGTKKREAYELNLHPDLPGEMIKK